MDAPLLKDKIRTEVICPVCNIHTTQIKKTIQGKEMWLCKECQSEVKDKKET